MLWSRWSGLTDEMNRLQGAAEVDGLLLFAAGAADSLSYLADLDERAFGPEGHLHGHNAGVVDLAHARWATSTSLTAVDLSAAALGRLFLGARGRGGEYDLGDFDTATIERLRAVNPWAATWIGEVLDDARYAVLKDARDALVHRRLTRTVKLKGRVDLHLKSGEVEVRSLILTARVFAAERVGEVLDEIPRLS